MNVDLFVLLMVCFGLERERANTHRGLCFMDLCAAFFAFVRTDERHGRLRIWRRALEVPGIGSVESLLWVVACFSAPFTSP